MQGVGFARRPCAFQMEDKSSRHYQDRQECVILGTTHAYPAQVIQHTLWRMASAAKHVKHPPKHIRNHMQHIYNSLRKHAHSTLTRLHDCMSLYMYSPGKFGSSVYGEPELYAWESPAPIHRAVVARWTSTSGYRAPSWHASRRKT